MLLRPHRTVVPHRERRPLATLRNNDRPRQRKPAHALCCAPIDSYFEHLRLIDDHLNYSTGYYPADPSFSMPVPFFPLADATRAEGRFSMLLDRARVPLQNPELGDVRGQLHIHLAQVGPGLHAKDIIALAQQIRGLLGGATAPANTTAGGTWMRLPEQQFAFSVQDGRVHHDRLVVTIGDVEIQTRGSVGFDESLDLVAQVPVQGAWVAGKPLLSAMRGTMLRIPVQGTMDQPRMDTRVLNDFGREAERGAARRLLENELERGLRGLFVPRP